MKKQGYHGERSDWKKNEEKQEEKEDKVVRKPEIGRVQKEKEDSFGDDDFDYDMGDDEFEELPDLPKQMFAKPIKPNFGKKT